MRVAFSLLLFLSAALACQDRWPECPRLRPYCGYEQDWMEKRVSFEARLAEWLWDNCCQTCTGAGFHEQLPEAPVPAPPQFLRALVVHSPSPSQPASSKRTQESRRKETESRPSVSQRPRPEVAKKAIPDGGTRPFLGGGGSPLPSSGGPKTMGKGLMGRPNSGAPVAIPKPPSLTATPQGTLKKEAGNWMPKREKTTTTTTPAPIEEDPVIRERMEKQGPCKGDSSFLCPRLAHYCGYEEERSDAVETYPPDLGIWMNNNCCATCSLRIN